MVFYQIFSIGFSMIINPDRYNLLYGTLGRLFLFLVNVYFLFMFFFFGAQLVQVLGISDALLFIRFRQFHSRLAPPASLQDKLFASPPVPLDKYKKLYKKGDFVFTKGGEGQEAFYLLSGEAGVYLDNECLSRVAIIEASHFFGEMAAITSEKRTACIKAETDLLVLVLPPELFRTIVQIDPETDHNLIKALSHRLKSVNQQIKS
jgi:membrane protein